MLTLREYAVIVEHSPVLIWRADRTGACDYFNDRWLQFRGRTLEQELGDGWLQGVHPDDQKACLATWRAHLAERTSFEIDYRMCRHDGEYRWIHDSGTPVHDAGGEFAGFVGSCVEVALLAAQSAHQIERELKNLRGLLSLCSWCHRVEDSRGAWVEIERYLSTHSSIDVTHGICPVCLSQHAAGA
jgi:PAS domain S-box-containing protein